MSREVMAMDRFSEIKRQLALGVSVIQISRNLNSCERTIREIRDGKMMAPSEREQGPRGPISANLLKTSIESIF